MLSAPEFDHRRLELTVGDPGALEHLGNVRDLALLLRLAHDAPLRVWAVADGIVCEVTGLGRPPM